MADIYVENIKSQMRKGVLEFCVLLILKRRPAYASELIASLKEAHLIVVEGTLYPLLTRMKKFGFLSYKWVESTLGPPRKYYELTSLGNEALEALRSMFADIELSVSILNNNDNQPDSATEDDGTMNKEQ